MSLNRKGVISLFILFTITLVIASCEKHGPTPFFRITVKNNAQQAVCPMMQDWSMMLNEDTSLPEVKPSLQIVGNGGEARFDNDEDWKKEFDRAGLDSATFFFIDANVYQNNSWVQIRDNYMVLKRVKYSVAQLEAADWVIQYP